MKSEWIVKYEVHYKYVSSTEIEYRSKFFLVAWAMYQFYSMCYSMSMMPIRCIRLYKNHGNGLFTIKHGYFRCNDLEQYKKIRKSK